MVKKSLIPFHSNLILEPIGPREKTDAGIIIPPIAQSIVNQGKVVDKGPDCSDKIQLGDIVFFPLHVEHRLNLSDKYKFIVVDEVNVLGSIRTEEIEEVREQLTVDEWCKKLGKTIVDYDGFRDLNPDDEISQADFERGLMLCTQDHSVKK